MNERPASPEEMNRFVKTVDEFLTKYKILTGPKTRAVVYDSGDNNLIRAYESEVSKASALKSSIEATTGAWQAAKKFYAETTDTTSTFIGDAIDEVRSWFGYDPSGGLGAVQIPAAIVVAGLITAAVAVNASMSKLFIQIEAARLQRDDPTMSRAEALDRAQNALAPSFFSGLNTVTIIAGAVAVMILLNMKKRG